MNVERGPAAATAAGLHWTADGIVAHASIVDVGGVRLVGGPPVPNPERGDLTFGFVHWSGGVVSWELARRAGRPLASTDRRCGRVDVARLLFGPARWTSRRIWHTRATVEVDDQSVGCMVHVDDHVRRRRARVLARVRHISVAVDPPGVYDRWGGRHLGWSGPLPARIVGFRGDIDAVLWAVGQVATAVRAANANADQGRAR